MTVEEFINEYNQASDKEKCIKKHILKDKYVPYAEKITRCKNIVDSTMYVEIKDKKVFKQNSPSQYMWFSMELIRLYTDLEIKNLLEDFDKLEEKELIDLFLLLINPYEHKKFDMILEMMIDDIMINTRDFVSYIDDKFNSIDLFNSILNQSINMGELNE